MWPSRGIGIAQTFAVLAYTAYASRAPSAEKAIDCTPIPVVTRVGSRVGSRAAAAPAPTSSA